MAVDLGDQVPLTVETRDAAGALANAGSITLTITLPDRTTVTPAVTNPSIGRYQVDYLTAQAGRHRVRWVATGANASAYPDVFNVDLADNGALVSLAEVKAHLNYGTSTTDDEEIRDWIPTATPIIERHTGKTIVQRTFVDRITTGSTDQLWLNHHPVISLTSIATLDGVTTWSVTATDVDIDPDLGVLTLLAGTPWSGRLKVTYIAGMAVVPDNYSKAARIIVQHLWETQRGTRGGPRVGGMDDTTAVVMGYAIPNRALELLGPTPPMVA